MLSGEAALRQVLANLDNKALIQIARSRGVNVAAEAQLKPSVGNPRIIQKILDRHSFTPDELQNIRDQYIELSQQQRIITSPRGGGGLVSHEFRDIGKESTSNPRATAILPRTGP